MVTLVKLTTMALLPQVVDAVNIPVIGAGGIGDGRGITAAFALGASGIQVGTRFLASEECQIHDNYKNAVINSEILILLLLEDLQDTLFKY